MQLDGVELHRAGSANWILCLNLKCVTALVVTLGSGARFVRGCAAKGKACKTPALSSNSYSFIEQLALCQSDEKLYANMFFLNRIKWNNRATISNLEYVSVLQRAAQFEDTGGSLMQLMSAWKFNFICNLLCISTTAGQYMLTKCTTQSHAKSSWFVFSLRCEHKNMTHFPTSPIWTGH